ncbi:MAG: hypothetical protein NTW20_15710 [Rhodobacterales bacterium]|nr:hypothetical protein [Rhodobacterales bacterium]
MATTVEKNRFGQFPVIVGIPVAVFFTLIFISLGQGASFWRTLGTGLLVGSASGLMGAFFGFLFGMPRDLSGRPGLQKTPDDPNATPLAAVGPAAAMENGRIAWANNNLVEVSDWLTKIIVGIGLVEFRALVPWIGGISETAGIAAGFNGTSAQATFGVSIILASFVYGFLIAYIYARTIIAVIFAKAQNEVDDELRIQLRQMVSEREVLASEKAILQEREAEGQRRFEAVINDLPEDIKGPSAVLAALYGAPPQGFTEAIDKARRLIADPAQGSNPRLQAYLAFGLGQKYRFEHERAAPTADLKLIATEAHAAIERALAIDAGLKPWMHSLWSREDPGFLPSEDDLTPFWDSLDERPRFADLLG